VGKGRGRLKCVPTYEKIFDIIDCAYKALGHAKCRRKRKNKIQSSWYGLPMSAKLLYLQTCPFCASSKNILKKKRNPLKSIVSQQAVTILDPWVVILYGRIEGETMVFYLLAGKDKFDNDCLCCARLLVLCYALLIIIYIFL
jgi:hypothetical protein